MAIPRWRKTLARRLAKFGYGNYAQYLRSPHWIELKKQFFSQRKRRCQFCGERKNINLHHITYRRLGEERLEDLIALCKSHHDELHVILNAITLKDPSASLRTITGEYFFGSVRYKKLERRRLLRRRRGKLTSHFAWVKPKKSLT